jgi:hypothetical protein
LLDELQDEEMFSIENDEDEIVSAICSNNHYCKILLKTVDEPTLLPIWLDHYLKLFDPQQIIIADNGSTDPDVLSIYEDISSDILVFSYSGDKTGYHNNIHDRQKFSKLYKAIADSCEFILSVDTDELLFVADEKTWSLDRARLRGLMEKSQGKAISTTWVHTIHGSLDTFYIGATPERLAWDLRWGKPFIPSSFAEGGVRIHNTQFPRSLFDPDVGADFFLLHLINYSKEQRLRVNKRKLIARAAAKEQDSFEEITARDYAEFRDPTVTRLVGEISKLLKEQWPSNTSSTLSRFCVRLASDGRVEYSDDVTEKVMTDFRKGFPSFFEEGFKPKP